MAKLEKNSFCKLDLLVKLYIISSIWMLDLADGQSIIDCISASNNREGIYVFTSPAARVPQGTELSFLCCLHTNRAGLSFPRWIFDPIENYKKFTEGSGKSSVLSGNYYYHRTLNTTALPSINNTEVSCRGHDGLNTVFSNVTKIIVLGKCSQLCTCRVANYETI